MSPMIIPRIDSFDPEFDTASARKCRAHWDWDETWGSLRRPELYTHSRLSADPAEKEIRLLEILPSTPGFEHIIECNLHHVPLSTEKSQPYEALSYCWGESSLGRWVTINDASSGRRSLEVTDNLYSALWRLQKPSESRMIWADAICINQKDDDEKAVQILLMRDIYSRAKRTIIWLGEHSEDGRSERGVQFMLRVLEVRVYDQKHGIKRDLFQQPQPHSHVPKLPAPTSPLWWYMLGLLEREWFSRAWIVQELCVPSADPLVMLGSYQLGWDEFWTAITFTTEIAGPRLAAWGSAALYIDHCEKLDQLRKQYQQEGGDTRGLTAMEVLMYSQKSDATKPHDHLFAFYGLLAQGSHHRYRDYDLPEPNSRLPVEEIYRQAAVSLIRHLGNLDLLSLTSVTLQGTTSNHLAQCNGSKRRRGSGRGGRITLPGLPTWAPNFTADGQTEPFLYRHFLTAFRPSQRPRYRASGDSTYRPELDAAGQRLLLKGHILGIVAETSHVVRPPARMELTECPEYRANLVQSYLAYRRALLSCESVAGLWKWGRYKPTGESRMRAYCFTIHGAADGFLHEKINADGIEILFNLWLVFAMIPARIFWLLGLDTPSFFAKWGQAMVWLTWIRVALFGWGPAIGPSTHAFDILLTRLAHRRVVRLEHWEEGEYIGLGPPLTRLGDVVVLCRGAKMPLVLRLKGQGAWEFIGECYVHGIQDGRRWETLESQRIANGERETEFWVA